MEATSLAEILDQQTAAALAFLAKLRTIFATSKAPPVPEAYVFPSGRRAASIDQPGLKQVSSSRMAAQLRAFLF